MLLGSSSIIILSTTTIGTNIFLYIRVIHFKSIKVFLKRKSNRKNINKSL